MREAEKGGLGKSSALSLDGDGPMFGRGFAVHVDDICFVAARC